MNFFQGANIELIRRSRFVSSVFTRVKKIKRSDRAHFTSLRGSESFIKKQTLELKYYNIGDTFNKKAILRNRLHSVLFKSLANGQT